MRERLILAVHLLVTFAKVSRLGGVRAVAAESPILKQQLLIDGVSVCQMLNDAIAGQSLPKRISTDRDPLFRFHRWLANLRVLEIEEIKSVPNAPVSHPFVERLIGTIRREFLDRTYFWNAVDLARKLDTYRDYYNEHRVHRALGGATPSECAGTPSPIRANLDRYAWRSHCQGLFQTPVRA